MEQKLRARVSGDSGSRDTKVGSCMNAQRQHTNIWSIMTNRTFSKQLFACQRLWRQGRIGLSHILAFSGWWDILSNLQHM